MGDNMYDYGNNTTITCKSSSLANNHRPHSSSSDEISLFLHQILVGSSSSSSSSSSCSSSAALMAHTGRQTLSFSSPPSASTLLENTQLPSRSPRFKDEIAPLDYSDALNTTSSGVVFSPSGAYFSGNVMGSAANVSSSSVGASENETEEYDCESEEGLEALVDEVQAKPAPRGGSSKRSRAAEVHNLSEKRRRSRINEKMKALQNLIPNSNKTDKASMLDEAIEYLKQLQLQVQMLSMRNGLSLHPMCLPGVLPSVQLSQMRMAFGDDNGSLHMNTTGTLPVNQENRTQAMFGLADQCTASNQLSVPIMSNITNSETSFGLESSIHAHFGPFHIHRSSEEICRENMLPHQQLNVNHSEANPSGACMIGRDQSDSLLSKSMEGNLILSPHLIGLQTGRSDPNDDIKIKRPNL